MMMAFTTFGFLQITGKLLTYLGYAAIAGAFYTPLLCREGFQAEARRKTVSLYLRWCLIALVTGIAGGLMWFFAKTGAMASRGITGAFDPLMLKILWSTAPGDALLAKLSAFSVALIAIIFYLISQQRHHGVFYAATGIAMVAAATSSTLTGHISQQALPDHIALILHIMTMSWWIGTLPLLVVVSHQHRPHQVKAIMQRFGLHAWFAVTLLLVTGITMLNALISLPDALYRTDYGTIFLVKAAFVLMILGLAAWHKWHLVPGLTDNTQTFARSVQVECVIAISILLTTATFTTLTGPAH